MKKILTLLSISLASYGVQAQSIDLFVDPIMIENQIINSSVPISYSQFFDQDAEVGDSIPGVILYGIDSNGGTYTHEDTILFFNPISELNLSNGNLSGTYTWLPEDADEVETDTSAQYVYLERRLKNTDSIQTLLNISYFEANFLDSGGVGLPFVNMLYDRSQLVNGQTYGWYAHVRPYPGWDEGNFTDTNKLNNWAYTPVIWQAGVVGLDDLIKNTKYTPLEIYPNPTADKVSFKLDFDKTNKSTVARVLDINGRSIHSVSLGSGVGTQIYSVDVSNLAPGNYSLQIITDHTISVEKFVKK